jgi:GYF domain 2/Domain of unknown function (DUF4190)
MSGAAGNWYLRTRGRVLGPFTWAQLESLRDRGQLARFHEISEDRQTWMNAGGVAQLFPHPDGIAGLAAANAGTASPLAYAVVGESNQPSTVSVAHDDAEWFIARGGTHHGPLAARDVQRMVTSGEIVPATLVWKKGMASWAPAEQIRELQFHAGSSGRADLHSDIPGQPGIAATILAVEPRRTSGLAIASLVLGLVSLCGGGGLLATHAAYASHPPGGPVVSSLMLGVFLLSGLGSLLATIFGGFSLSQISRAGRRIEGKGFAIAGLVLGILGLALFAVPFITSFLALVAQQAERNRR